jgi:hypothetical protein
MVLQHRAAHGQRVWAGREELGGEIVSDYGSKSRQQMMARFVLERRQRNIRRLFYHAMDYAGFVCWAMVVVMLTACAVFILGHR